MCHRWTICLLLQLLIASLVVQGLDNDEEVEEEDIVNIEDKWKEYRNLVKGGFFVNDSMIVMTDVGDLPIEIAENSTKDIEDRKVKDKSDALKVSIQRVLCDL